MPMANTVLGQSHWNQSKRFGALAVLDRVDFHVQ